MRNPVYLDGNLISGGITYLTPECYSTEERVVGCWIDGKPLYQKTMYAPTGTFTVVADWTAINGFSNIDKLIETKINVIRSAESRVIYQRSDNTDVLPRFEANNGNIYYFTDTNTFAFYNWDWYITFQYTKSTDTAGSGILTPSGIPTVHYSTEEHVIGTWIDGSTLYEKSFVIDSNISGSHNHGIANFGTLVSTNGSLYRHDGKQFPITFINTSQNSWQAGLIDIDGTAFVLTIGSSFTSNYAFDKAIVTFQYTKSS